jgi:2-polyprenyl-3-methyl-5-hydroxy-6-metoxy-1,4-benzoquinol methylase
MKPNSCKICGSESLVVFAHTAKCGRCGVLLFYPYPKEDNQLVSDGDPKEFFDREQALFWYSKSSFFNHDNFTDMVRFMMDESDKNRKLDILDYGGGGGQFSLVCKSNFPEATIYITDISDIALLDEWRPNNIQILFKDFDKDKRKFDYIFLNDVFEHVSNPLFVLNQFIKKIKDNGKIFIDTPKQFWGLPITKIFSKFLYKKVLKGTVSKSHLSIWVKKSFDLLLIKLIFTKEIYWTE